MSAYTNTHRTTPIVHVDGNFRIEDLRSVPGASNWMACHECEADYGKSRWKPFAFSPAAVSRACLNCGEHASDGFQGLYWMLALDQLK